MNIGIIGRLGSGKTFAANYLVKKYGFHKVSLATPIKEIMAKYFKVYDKSDARYRRLAQKIGTDWFRSEYPDVWIDYMIEETSKYDELFVCDDVRFLNEAERLLSSGWLLLYMDCPDQIRIERCILRDKTFDPLTMNHPSETGVEEILNKYQSKIINIDSSGSMENTNKQLDDIVQCRTT